MLNRRGGQRAERRAAFAGLLERCMLPVMQHGIARLQRFHGAADRQHLADAGIARRERVLGIRELGHAEAAVYAGVHGQFGAGADEQAAVPDKHFVGHKGVIEFQFFDDATVLFPEIRGAGFSRALLLPAGALIVAGSRCGTTRRRVSRRRPRSAAAARNRPGRPAPGS